MGRHSRRSHVKRCGTCGKYRVVGAGWMDWATKAGLSAASKAASWGQRGMALGQKAAAAYKRAAPAIQSAREAYSKAAPLLAAAKGAYKDARAGRMGDAYARLTPAAAAARSAYDAAAPALRSARSAYDDIRAEFMPRPAEGAAELEDEEPILSASGSGRRRTRGSGLYLR